MDEPKSTKTEELLARIHNQLVDLKQVLVEIELAQPGTSHSLQTRLRSFVGAAEYIEIDGQSPVTAQREHKVIAPPPAMSDEDKK